MTAGLWSHVSQLPCTSSSAPLLLRAELTCWPAEAERMIRQITATASPSTTRDACRTLSSSGNPRVASLKACTQHSEGDGDTLSPYHVAWPACTPAH